jgi:hypothetical protein
VCVCVCVQPNALFHVSRLLCARARACAHACCACCHGGASDDGALSTNCVLLLVQWFKCHGALVMFAALQGACGGGCIQSLLAMVWSSCMYHNMHFAFTMHQGSRPRNLLYEERLERAEARRLDGNALFAQGKYKEAMSKYCVVRGWMCSAALVRVVGGFDWLACMHAASGSLATVLPFQARSPTLASAPLLLQPSSTGAVIPR